VTPAPASAATEPVPFPSLAWFERLAALMNGNRARQEQLGYVDCVAAFTVTDGGPGGRPLSVHITFEEFGATDVRIVASGAAEAARADFTLAADLATWRAMIESIAAGHGRPALDYTLNRLTHLGEPMRVSSDDPLRRDLYFRYNQSLQEFVNASAAFVTTFAA
jgi:hypothetical protein